MTTPPPTVDPRLAAVAREHPYPLLFATVSGAHLYGFPSPDSDFDLRGAHVLPADQVLGLYPTEDTVERAHPPQFAGDLDLDLVTHDARKFFELLLKKNGYVLEQLYSPLVVVTTPEHEELKRIARGCITRHHVHHYLGFAQNQWQLFAKETPPRVKPLLYVYRVLLTGIHLMRTGEVAANLVRLNELFRLPYIDELVARKVEGREKSPLDDADLAFHRAEYERLETTLREAGERSTLPETATARDELSNLLVRLRLQAAVAGS